MTPLDRIEKALAEMEAREKAATEGPYMGRSEEWGGRLVWVIYRGRDGVDGFAGKAPIAFFRNHADAVRFTKRGQLPLIAALRRLMKGRALWQAELEAIADALEGSSS